MLQEIKIKYFNESLQIAMVNWKEVYLVKPQIMKLHVEVDKGRLVYRATGSGKRISYRTVKKGLKKKAFQFLKNYRVGYLIPLRQRPLKNKKALKVNAVKAFLF